MIANIVIIGAVAVYAGYVIYRQQKLRKQPGAGCAGCSGCTGGCHGGCAQKAEEKD